MTIAWLERQPDRLKKQHKRLLNQAKKNGLADHFPAIESEAKLAIEFKYRKAKAADLKQVGSRIGGQPDLPEETGWPEHEGSPLMFIGQILLSEEIVSLDVDDMLPRSGLLSFFAKVEGAVSGSSVECAVMYSGDIGQLVRTAPPTPASCHEKTGLLQPWPRFSVAPTGSAMIDSLGLDDAQEEAYLGEVFREPIPEGRLHQLLGWPNAASIHDVDGRQLLAQLDSEHKIGMKFGEFDTLRFYFESQDRGEKGLASVVCALESLWTMRTKLA